MAIKRYYATQDTTITNAFKSNLITRGTGSNMGESDIVEVFSIYGQSVTTGSGTDSGEQTQELSRFLVKFPVSGTTTGEIQADRTAGTIPASGNVNFYLTMYNARHGQTLPTNATYVVQAVSQSWTEGTGLDMEEYVNYGEANWMSRSSDDAWTQNGGQYTVGGTYHTATYTAADGTLPTYKVTQESGVENIELDITSLVEEWLADSQENYGLGVRLTASQEGYYSSSVPTTQENGYSGNGILQNVDGAKRSYYTKKFFARGTEFFFKRPAIEARWDSSKKDNRSNFQYSSSLASATDNLNTLYMYNYVKGQLKDIPDLTDNVIYVRIFSGSADSSAPSGSHISCSVGGGVIGTQPYYITGGLSSTTGIYTASVALTASTVPLTTMFDVWSNAEDSSPHIQFFTGSFQPKKLSALETNPNTTYVTTITNLKPSYTTNEEAKLRLFVRERDWNPNIYVVASKDIETTTIENAYYKVIRVYDDLEVISYGTGSDNLDYTRLSFDVSGNYFDLDLSLLEADSMYSIKFAYYINGQYREQPEVFKFRVENQ